MADVDIELALQGGEVEGGRRHYEPSSPVRGSVRLTPHDTVDCRRVVTRLEWHTEGTGDRDRECVDETELVTGPLSEPVDRRFTLTVPRQPWSYSGRYLNIIWHVGVMVDIPLAKNISAEEQIIVAPRRATTPRRNRPAGTAQLRNGGDVTEAS
jgi:hypothetical protein